MNEKTYLLPESLLKGLIEYLASRPYREVANAVISLQNLEESTSPKEDE